jgi:hypothetical protein
MKLHVVRTDFALFPASESDAEKLKKIKSGEVLEVEIKKARNYQFHKKLFALLNLGFEAQNSFTAFDWWREYITMKAGFFESCKAPNGEFMYRAKSISFEKMDDFEFSELYKAVSQAIIEVCHITQKQLEDNLKLFV